VGSGDRSEKIRTYNYKDNRLTDHRLGRNFSLEPALNGLLEELIEACIASEQRHQLEQLALSGITQLFMDAPYRNNQVLDDLLQTCRMDTKLCIASNITCDNERINTKTITEWSIRKPDLNKMPVMFVLGK
jgi:precorrin-6B methylase 1